MSVDLSTVESTLAYSSLEQDQILCLLPVRLETKFFAADGAGQRRLMIRIFPDDIHVDTHNSVLSLEEQLIALTYRQRFDATSDQALHVALWHQFCALVGSSRASYLGKLTTTELQNASISSSGTWRTPYARCLPTQWVAFGYRNGVRVKMSLSQPVDDLATSGISGAFSVGPDFSLNVQSIPSDIADIMPAWMRDVGVAESVGMAIRMELPSTTADDQIWNDGLDQLIVFGLNTQDNSTVSASSLEGLFEAHTYTRGFDVVARQSATTSTSSQVSSYSRVQTPDLYARGFAQTTTNLAGEDESEGQRLARAFGLPNSAVFTQLSNHERQHDLDVVQMHTLLWPVSLGYYTEQMLYPLTGWRERRILREQFIYSVRAQGPLQSLRVGSQPYGILPCLRLSEYEPLIEDPETELEDAQTTEFPEHYLVMKLQQSVSALDHTYVWNQDHVKDVLLELKQFWLSEGLGDVPRIEPADADPTGSLTQVIAQYHHLQELRQRPVIGDEVYRRLVDSAGWPQAALSWHDGAESTIESVIDSLGLRQVINSSSPTLRISSTHPFCLSQQVSGQLVNEGTVLADGYLNTLSTMSIPNVLNQNTWLSALSNPATLPTLAILAYEATRRVIETTTWVICQVRGRLGSYPPVTPEFEALNGYTTPNSVNLDGLLDLTIGTLGLSVDTLASSNTLRDALELLRQWALQETLDDIVTNRFMGTVEPWEIDEFFEHYNALSHLKLVNANTLEQVLVHGLDSCTHRLDAWHTSIATRRLFHIRKGTDGIHVGGYGVLEDVRRNKDLARLGVIHAPSQAQAQTAAVIKSAQLNHHNTAQDGLLDIDLSSARVRQALWILHEIKQGAHLGDVLGSRLEKLLSVRAEGIAASTKRLLVPLRRAFGKHHTNEGAADTPVTDQQHVDGLQVLRSYQENAAALVNQLNTALGELAPGSNSVNATEQALLFEVLEELGTSMRAMHDVMLTESVHQSTLGNAAKAKAALDVLSGGATPMTDLDFIHTPFESTKMSHHVGLLSTPATSVSYPWGHDATSLRVTLAPELASWLERLIPDPDKYICNVTAYDVEGQLRHHRLRLKQLNLSAIDLLALATSSKNIASGHLATMVQMAFYERLKARGIVLNTNKPITVQWAPVGLPATYKSFGHLFEVLETHRRLFQQTRPLRARDLVQTGQAIVDEYGWDLGELSSRVNGLISSIELIRDAMLDLIRLDDQLLVDAVNANKSLWSTPGDDLSLQDTLLALPELAQFDALGQLLYLTSPLTFMSDVDRAQARDLLGQMVLLGVEGARVQLPLEQPDQDAGVLTTLLVMVIRQVNTMLEKLTGASTAEALVQDIELLFGEHALWAASVSIPTVDLAKGLTDQAGLLDNEANRLQSWFAKMAHTQKQTGYLFDVYLATKDTQLSVAQLPYRTGDTWLADSLGVADAPAQSTSFMFMVDDQASITNQTTNFLGLSVDQWIEDVPLGQQTTGVAVHAQSPKAKAPQSMLMVVPPVLGQDWRVVDVEKSLIETIELAKMRGVDPATLGGLSHLLPTLYIPFTTVTDDVPVEG